MNSTIQYSELDSPLGKIVVCGDGPFVTGLFLPDHKGFSGIDARWTRSDARFAEIRAQLAEYFAGTRQSFDVPLRLDGTPFQKRVWQELVNIPFGSTITYAELARRIGRPTASRAVGHANGRNPVSILIPCHRVVATDGKLTGYAGGISRKKWLIDLERAASAETRFRPGRDPKSQRATVAR
ncbi:MAG: methylated-DNA--[protein]-cysteine S-methyltransferase [Planctomycetaceae bacterium]